MQKFRFRLNTLLKVRRIAENQAQMSFTEACRQLAVEREKQQKIEQELIRCLEHLRTSENGLIPIDSLKVYRNFADIIKERLSLQTEILSSAAAVREERLEELHMAMRNRKLVETLKEKRFAQYQAETLKAEQAELDEMGLRARSASREV